MWMMQHYVSMVLPVKEERYGLFVKSDWLALYIPFMLANVADMMWFDQYLMIYI